MNHRAIATGFALLMLLSGCLQNGPAEAVGGDANLTQPTTSAPSFAAFVVDGPRILPPDGSDRDLREDDGSAIVRYTVRRLEGDTGPDSAFVTYLLDGRLIDTESVRLAPGRERIYERTIPGLKIGDAHRVEVRAGASATHATSTVLAWPRPGEPLALGNLTVRIDYGLSYPEADRVGVNVTIIRAASPEPITEFRVKLVCIHEGRLVIGESHRGGLPAQGTTSGIDFDLPDCPKGDDRYGLEFKLDAPGRIYVGRTLLVAKGYFVPAS